MKRGMVVSLLQGPSMEYGWLDTLASEFGWSVETVGGVAGISHVAARAQVIAVLFDAKAGDGSWTLALRSIQETAPEALPILCHTSSEKIPWPDLAEAGAFHALLLPLHAAEVRQSLAFVCAAQTRRRPIRMMPTRRQPSARDTEQPVVAAAVR